jgi:prepilin-type N-terminal cleavage/methylation domain-containing protein
MDSIFNRVARRRRRGQRGFTLIELLVVIAVLAILAAIVIFNVVGVANRGKSSACATDQQTVQTAVDAYFNDHNLYADSTGGDTATPANGDTVNTAELVSGNGFPPYIHTLPPETFKYTTNPGTIAASPAC